MFSEKIISAIFLTLLAIPLANSSVLLEPLVGHIIAKDPLDDSNGALSNGVAKKYEYKYTARSYGGRLGFAGRIYDRCPI